MKNVVEQDHHGVKRVTRPMLGFKSFEAAHAALVGIELMHMIKKEQLGEEARTQALRRPNNSPPWPHNPEPSRALSIIPQNMRPEHQEHQCCRPLGEVCVVSREGKEFRCLRSQEAFEPWFRCP